MISNYEDSRLNQLMKLLNEADNPVERGTLLSELQVKIDGLISAMLRNANESFDNQMRAEALEKVLEWVKFAYKSDVRDGQDNHYKALETFIMIETDEDYA